MKAKKFFKTVGKGAREVGTRVRSGSMQLIQKAREYNTPQAQQARLDSQEKSLRTKVRITQQRARIQNLQKQAGSGGFGIDMGGLFGGGGFDSSSGFDMISGGKRKGGRRNRPFNPMEI